MRLYELLNQSTRQQLDSPGQDNQEDDQQGKFDADRVDSSLQDVAQQVDDQDAQPDLPSGSEQEQPELDDQNVKPIDSALMGRIQNLPYASRYQFDDKSALNPLKIAGMQISDLNNLANMVRFKMQATMMRDRIGADQDTDMQFYNDLLKFINTVRTFKKTNTKAQTTAHNAIPAYQSRAANSNTPPAANDNSQISSRKSA
jgi:hypothetical protein